MGLIADIAEAKKLGELIAQLVRIADALERAYPPRKLTTKAPREEPQLFESTDEQTYEFELEDQIQWLKEKQPKIFEEIREKLEALEPE